MYDGEGAEQSSSVPGRTPDPAVTGTRNARYGYLVARLRSRRITIEEATELFSVLQDALARSAGEGAPPQARETVIRDSGAVKGSPSLAPPPDRDETVALGMLALGAGAGLLAAILKRSTEGPRSVPSK